VKAIGIGELEEGDVKPVTLGTQTIALSFKNGTHGAVDNQCPHQGGPMGEGTIDDKNCLQCPWHGWTFDRVTGKSEYGDELASYPVEVRDDGVYVEIEQRASTARTVSDLMIETMVNWGVTHVFGMVGHSNLGLAEAIRKQEQAGKLTFVGIRHEGAAAFAASGYAKASGKPAACLTIAGPGATNLLTGIWDAKVDRAPLLALTGQVQTQVLGPGAFQEIDLASAFRAAVSWSQTVLASSDHAELMNLALKHTLVNREPTHLIFPDEVQVIEAATSVQAGGPEGRLGRPEITPSNDSLEAALQEVQAAKQPAIIIGHGARDHVLAILELAERLEAPVLSTFKAKGLVGDAHPLAAGVLGRSGTPVAASCMTDADLLIVIGASFAQHTGIDAGKRIVQVDFDRMALGKFHPVTVPVWGEIGTTVARLSSALGGKSTATGVQERLARLWREWREEKRKRAAKDNGRGIASAYLFEQLSGLAPRDAVIAVDVGNNTYSFGRYFECSGSQTILMSGYLGSIGFGFPAAMGAWAACPDRPILCITGDGGFGQYLAEFTTAVKYGMNLTHVLLNNHELGKISKEQRAGNWQVWQTSLHNPDFADYASNCGGLGTRVEERERLISALQQALAHDGPALVEVMTDAELV
jgi:thiamine pyrophosphate-dependent acetolactate synthase large subunit-like protein/nitrite reductase/ring-hydroxylating ferredoxin subunit